MESSVGRNFGKLTVASKKVNRILGDKSGRLVSMRTAHGFKNAFQFDDLDEDVAEDIVHTAMMMTVPLLSGKHKVETGIGSLMVAVLFIFYHMGRND